MNGLAKVNGNKIQIRGDISDQPILKCKHCQAEAFVTAVRIRKVSGLINSTGRTQYVHQGVMVCAACGQQLEEKP